MSRRRRPLGQIFSLPILAVMGLALALAPAADAQQRHQGRNQQGAPAQGAPAQQIAPGQDDSSGATGQGGAGRRGRGRGGGGGDLQADRQMVSAMQREAHALVHAGRLQEAESAARRVLQDLESRDPEHPLLGVPYFEVGRIQLARGRSAEATASLERARGFAERNPRQGPTSPLMGGILASLARAQMAAGRFAQGQALLVRAISIREAAAAQDSEDPAVGLDRLIGLAGDYLLLDRPADAARTMQRALALAERVIGRDSIETAFVLADLARMSENVTPTAEVRAYAERALAIAGTRPDGAVVAGRALVQRAWAASLEGRFAEAEADVRRALPALERGGDEVQRSQGLVILSQLLAQRAQWLEAERAAFQAITTAEASLGREHYFVSNGLYALGRVYLRSGRPTEAEPILRRAAAVRERGRGAGDGFLASIRSELAQALDALGRLPEAIALLEASRNANDSVKRTLAGLYLKAGRLDQAEAMAREALAISNQRSGPDAPLNASSLYILGRVLIARNRAPEAEPMLRRVLDMRQRALGRLHPDVASAWYGLSRALAAQGKAGEALDAAGRATRLAVEREGASGSDDGAERLSRRELFVWQLELLARALARDEAQPVLLDQAFRAVQSAKEGRTAAAISRMADRVGADDPRLAELLRARSDALDDIAREAEAVRIAMAGGGDAGHRARLEAARRRQAELDRQIARQFPSYSFALGDDAARLADAQGALAPDEAIVDLLVVRDRVFAMVVRSDRAALVAGEAGAASDLAALVRRLRAGVDPSATVSIETLPRFDFDAAYALYRATLGPAEPFLAGVTHLFIVPDGPLQSIPFGMLLTAPAGAEADAFARARAAPWLARRLATTVEPAATAVRALRQVARPTQATAPFIGIGNPVLAGPVAATRGAAAGRNAPAPRVAQAAGATRAPVAPGAPVAPVPPAAPAVAFGVTRGAPIDVGRIFTRAGVDVRALRELAPLPETADELRILARALGASDDVLVLGRDATKPRVRATDLSRYRVIAFATHGLVAGDVPGFGEPGLVLTPPERATPDDDGLLGASTIARLRLDADLVILSACNTAAADGSPGAEALSGLARAFLYAGSRALMVSHWPVASQATVRLTTGLVEAQRADPQIGRAEALRRSEMALLDDRATGYYAHPLFWAPFIIVGEGGRPIAVPPPTDAPAAAEDDDTL